MKVLLVIILSILINLNQCLDNGLGLTPPMGWNSWNHFACDISEDLIKAQADALITHGLHKLGYTYINLDDCWQIDRDNDTKKIIPDPKKFPSGIANLSKYMHDRDLKLGLYSDAGKMTCQKRPGSLGFEKIDADTYAEWEVDYLKYDNCFNENILPWQRYIPMRDALNQTGRPIYFSMCEWGFYFPWLWAKDMANSWRITPDITDSYISFLLITDVSSWLSSFAGPGHWNDPDMLEVGNGGMSDSEYQAQFAMWAIIKAPLILGCDLRNMSYQTLQIISNEEVIAVNQDKLGIQGKRVQSSGWLNQRTEVWSGELENGEYAVLLFNRGNNAGQTITADFKKVGYKGSVALVRDIINKKDMGPFINQFSAFVPGRSVVMVRLSTPGQQDIIQI